MRFLHFFVIICFLVSGSYALSAFAHEEDDHQHEDEPIGITVHDDSQTTDIAVTETTDEREGSIDLREGKWSVESTSPFILMGLLIIAVLISVLAGIFWIWMLIDAARRKFTVDNEKIAWLLVIIFAGFIGAVIYFFVVKLRKEV